MVYTQNSEGMEGRAGIPDEKVVYANGRIDSAARCIKCRRCFSKEDFIKHARAKKVLFCSCGSPVKPSIVFTSEALSEDFSAHRDDIRGADFVFVMGSSLRSFPFNTLMSRIPDHVPRVLVNLDKVFESTTSSALEPYVFKFDPAAPRARDIFLAGKCDNVLEKIANSMGAH